MQLSLSLHSTRRRCSPGFTLEEVLVAISLVGITALSTVSGYVTVAKRSDWASRSAAANAAAVQRVEQIRAARWDTLASPPVDEVVAAHFPDLVVPLDVPQKEASLVQARVKTFIDRISDQPPVRLVRVECIWSSLDQRLFTNTVVAYRTPGQ